MFGLIHGSKHLVAHGAKHGGASLYGAPLDGTSLVFRPASVSDWLGIGLPVPSYRWGLQEAAGPITDDVRGVAMTASGAVAYLQSGTELSYASKGVSTVDGTASMGFTAATGELWNVRFQAIVVYLEVEVTGIPAALRSLFALTGAASFYVGLVQATASKANLSCRSAATTNGTFDYNDGKRHPVLIELIPAAATTDHTGAGLFRVSTDKQQITGTWSFTSDGTKGLGTGGSASLTSAPAKYFDCAVWAGTDAETISTLTPKVALQRKGWVVTGY